MGYKVENATILGVLLLCSLIFMPMESFAFDASSGGGDFIKGIVSDIKVAMQYLRDHGVDDFRKLLEKLRDSKK